MDHIPFEHIVYKKYLETTLKNIEALGIDMTLQGNKSARPNARSIENSVAKRGARSREYLETSVDHIDHVVEFDFLNHELPRVSRCSMRRTYIPGDGEEDRRAAT
ncbi:hypothetical protein [Acidisoma sp. S159]|uniref:hypothetical protein n=1 Tax=Acidisoma sp. S159 TaxID=1747225 RepID=UPI00131D9824|nr:hypothetical protein [Acidisoma sp. S159]